MFQQLEKFLWTDGKQLGLGKDVKWNGAAPNAHPWKASYTYRRLKLVRAWKIENPLLSAMYKLGKEYIRREMQVLQADGVVIQGAHGEMRHKAWSSQGQGLPPQSQKVLSAASPGDFALDAAVNEAWLYQGTAVGNLWNIATNGFNEKFSGSNAGAAYGYGNYFAEGADKAEQYAKPDVAFDPVNIEVHQKMYAGWQEHPGNMGYIFLNRVSLGLPVRVRKGFGPMSVKNPLGPEKKTINNPFAEVKDIDFQQRICPITQRELRTVDAQHPTINHHSILGELKAPLSNKRFREIVSFHSEYSDPVYILGFQRYDQNGQLVKVTDTSR